MINCEISYVQRFSNSSSSGARLANLHGIVAVIGGGYVVVVYVKVDLLRHVLSQTYSSSEVVDGIQLVLPLFKYLISSEEALKAKTHHSHPTQEEEEDE